jgi:hypothetical protein
MKALMDALIMIAQFWLALVITYGLIAIALIGVQAAWRGVSVLFRK